MTAYWNLSIINKRKLHIQSNYYISSDQSGIKPNQLKSNRNRESSLDLIIPNKLNGCYLKKPAVYRYGSLYKSIKLNTPIKSINKNIIICKL